MILSVLLSIAAALVGDDPRDAVAKLVSPRSAERAVAQRTLETLGDAAYPALGEAAESSDLELRHKAAQMLDAIDGRRLARPTLVPLNVTNRPLAEAVQAVAKSADVTILVEPDGDPRTRSKTITLTSDSPVPLWEALDRLGRAGGLRIEPAINPAIRQRQMFAVNGMPPRRRMMAGHEIVLRFGDGTLPSAPASDSGAVRVTVSSIVLNRNRNFVRTAENFAVPEATTAFSIGFQVRAEPRLTIASLDDARLIEARDDRGQSLLPGPETAAGSPVAKMGMGQGMEIVARNQPLVFPLKYPEEPGRTMARLRGSVRALVIGRRGDPLSIPLGDAAGKTFSSGSSTVLVHAVRTAPDGRETTVEFTLDTMGGGIGAQPIFNPLDPRLGLRPPPAAKGQIEFFDADGRLCQQVDLATVGMGFGSGGRTTVMVQPPRGTGPPTLARYHAATWTTIEVTFDFRDVPMP